MSVPHPPHTKTIPLTQGKHAIVDEDDYDRLSRHKWHINSQGYAVRMSPRSTGKRTAIAMHREVLNVAARFLVDHINHDTLDNRKANLRIATKQDNARNSRPRAGTSRFKGVSVNRRDGRWCAYICVDGRNIALGRFFVEAEAAMAYDAAARELFGEFAYLNFPVGDEVAS